MTQNCFKLLMWFLLGSMTYHLIQIQLRIKNNAYPSLVSADTD